MATQHVLANLALPAPSDPRANRKKTQSLFWPAGPVTASHTKAREKHQSAVAGGGSVWRRSGPPTDWLLDAEHPSRFAKIAVVSLRRDLNKMKRDGDRSVIGLLDAPPNRTPRKERAPQRDPDDLSDDELWESIGLTSGTTRAELRKRAVARLVSDRCLPPLQYDERGNAVVPPPAPATRALAVTCAEHEYCGVKAWAKGKCDSCAGLIRFDEDVAECVACNRRLCKSCKQSAYIKPSAIDQPRGLTMGGELR